MSIHSNNVQKQRERLFHDEDHEDIGRSILTADESRMSSILQKALEFATEFLSSIQDRPAGAPPLLLSKSSEEGEASPSLRGEISSSDSRGEEGEEQREVREISRPSPSRGASSSSSSPHLKGGISCSRSSSEISSSREVSSSHSRGAPSSHSSSSFAPLSEEGVGAEQALNFFKQIYSANLSGSAGPRYLGFVTGGSTPAAIAGDWLVSTFDQNAAYSGDSCANHIENEVVQWLKELFGLSDSHSGAFVSGATMANFVGLAIARQWIGKKVGVDVAQDGLQSLSRIKVLSGNAHSSTVKALAMLGLGRSSLEKVQCLENREAVDVEALRNVFKVCKAAGEVCIVVGNAGTVNSGDFDDLLGIAKLKEEFDFWLHVDAAFGGFAACSPKFSNLVNGLDAADSITIDAHKWLNVPYDSAMQFTRHRQLQVEVFQNQGAYLGAVSLTDPDFVHLTPENSRRFRALPAWFSLMAYGKEGYRNLVEQSCEMAFQLGKKLTKSPNFTVLTPQTLNIVTFTIGRGDRPAKEVSRFLHLLNQKGDTFMTATRIGPHPAIRAAFSNWRTIYVDVEVIWKSLLETYVKGRFSRKEPEQETNELHEEVDELVAQDMELMAKFEEEMRQQEIKTEL